jgi:hypothetical protein
VVDALRKIHAALIPNGLLVDTQPVSPRPAVSVGSDVIGALNMRNWLRTIDAVDRRVAQTVAAGSWAHAGEDRFIVVDTFENGAELADTVRDWKGTRIARTLTERLLAAQGPAQVHQEVRMRLLRALS